MHTDYLSFSDREWRVHSIRNVVVDLGTRIARVVDKSVDLSLAARQNTGEPWTFCRTER